MPVAWRSKTRDWSTKAVPRTSFHAMWTGVPWTNLGLHHCLIYYFRNEYLQTYVVHKHQGLLACEFGKRYGVFQAWNINQKRYESIFGTTSPLRRPMRGGCQTSVGIHRTVANDWRAYLTQSTHAKKGRVSTPECMPFQKCHDLCRTRTCTWGKNVIELPTKTLSYYCSLAHANSHESEPGTRLHHVPTVRSWQQFQSSPEIPDKGCQDRNKSLSYKIYVDANVKWNSGGNSLTVQWIFPVVKWIPSSILNLHH